MTNYSRLLRYPNASMVIVACVLGLACLWSCQASPVATRRQGPQQPLTAAVPGMQPCCLPDEVHDLYAARFRLSPGQ